MRREASRVTLAVLALGSAACLSVQDYGSRATGPDAADAQAEEPPTPPIEDTAPRPGGTWRWAWVNPSPTGRTLHAIAGTAADDLWVAGDDGVIAHFDGARWDVRHAGPASTRYVAIGTKRRGDVWAAGVDGGEVGVVHFDGAEWTTSHPFAGADLRAFSHGTGGRLFAVVGWDILELTDQGTWERTDNGENLVFGPPIGVWVAASGEAWTLTSGAKLLRLAPGARKWRLEPPIADMPQAAAGVAISGAGDSVCAFYTQRSVVGPEAVAGYLRRDASGWHVGPTSTSLFTVVEGPRASPSVCLDDGTGLLLDDGGVVTASPSAPPVRRMLPTAMFDARLTSALSLDGKAVRAVGALGAFLERPASTDAWRDASPRVRHDLHGVDVGLDGAVMVHGPIDPDSRRGGEVLVWQDDALRPTKSAGIASPRTPAGVTVLGRDDAWVLSDLGGTPGVARWTGKWSATWRIDPGTVSGVVPKAIWAPAKDDVWVTAAAACPISGCTTPPRGYAWHHGPSGWTRIDVDGVYTSIHGTGLNDVWFAGDGVAHWDGTALTRVASLAGSFAGVWSSAAGRVWLWGEKEALLFDGTRSVPVETALNAATDWDVDGIAESAAGDVFVLAKRATGTTLLWFDPTRTRLVEQIVSDLRLTHIRGRGDALWAVGAGGASLRFSPPALR